MKPREAATTEPKRHEKRVIDTMAENLAAEVKVAGEAATATKENAGKKIRYSGLISKELWQAFTAINTKISVPNNSVINMLISKYVKENE